MAKRTNVELFDKLSDETFFKEFVAQCVSKSIVLAIDKAITAKPLSYTQKQQIVNYRDSGILNEIMLGRFEKVSIAKLIEIFSAFNLGLSLSVLNQDELSQLDNATTRH